MTPLSSREREIVQLLADGMTMPGIAHELGISRKTVDSHRHNIYKKIGIRDKALLARYAMKEGIVTDNDTPRPPAHIQSITIVHSTLDGAYAVTVADVDGTVSRARFMADVHTAMAQAVHYVTLMESARNPYVPSTQEAGKWR